MTGIRVAALLSVTLFNLFFVRSDAQNNTSNSSANVSTTPPPCPQECCDRPELRFEAKSICKSLSQWGITDADCYIWELNAVRFCQLSCSNCTVIAQAMQDQCLFFLQNNMLFNMALERCKVLGSDFLNSGRCESVCQTTIDDCFSDQGKYCMTHCGNYHECDCYKVRGVFGEPDLCVGETVLDGLMPDSSLPYSCVHTPSMCKNHHVPQSQCAKYKHCALDMCLIQNISCAVTDDCQAYGVCEKSTGKCFYTLKDDGVQCNDGKYYTHDDTCIGGTCIGWVDRCLRNGVACSTTNPCLKPHGSCSARTGACVFDKQPDGIACPFQPGDPLNGNCLEGVCRRPSVDKCLNKSCPLSDLGPCDKAIYPRCDPETGHCRSIWRPEGFSCDDGDPNTFNDMCIEGQCIGDMFPEPAFESIGEGHCANEHGHTLQRYFHDAFDDAACAKQCSRDPACTAYGFGYHQCSIYGGPRAVHPQMSIWGEQWYLGDMWGDMSIDANLTVVEYVVPLEPNEPKVLCMRKVGSVEVITEHSPIGHEIAFGFLLVLLVGSPAFFYCMLRFKAYMAALDEQYLLEHENDERDLTQGRSCCNFLRCCRCNFAHRHASESIDAMPQHVSRPGFCCCQRRPARSPRIFVQEASSNGSQFSSDQDLNPIVVEKLGSDSLPEQLVGNDQTSINGDGPTIRGLDPAPINRDDQSPIANQEKGRRRCCGCCCRRKGRPKKQFDEQGGTPVQIEPLQLDADDVSPLQPALSPRETSKASVAMAPNKEPSDEDIRDPRGEVEGDNQDEVGKQDMSSTAPET